MADQSRSPIIAGVLIAATATIGGAFIAVESWVDMSPSDTIEPAPAAGLPDVDDFFADTSAFLSRDNGDAGTSVSVSVEGLSPGERVVIRFHTEQIASTQTNSAGSFSNVAVEIPTSFADFAPQQFDIVLSGESSIKSASAPFTITG